MTSRTLEDTNPTRFLSLSVDDQAEKIREMPQFHFGVLLADLKPIHKAWLLTQMKCPLATQRLFAECGVATLAMICHSDLPKLMTQLNPGQCAALRQVWKLATAVEAE